METFIYTISIVYIMVTVIFYLTVFFISIRIYFYIKQKLTKCNKVNLSEEINPDWISEENAIQVEQELINLSFTPDKAYKVLEMEGMQLKAYFNTPYAAVMYTHPIAGIWVDMVSAVKNGKEYTVSNAPMGREIYTPPNTEKHWLKDLSVTQCFDKLKEVVGSQPINALNTNSFRNYFENTYKLEIALEN